MRRRGDHTASYRCPESGCPEVGRFAYSNREQGKRLESSYGGGKWRCVRHTTPDEVLSPTNRARQVVMVLGKSEGAPGLYWSRTDGRGLVSGFAHGMGWKAFAGDFPEGTRIVTRVEVVLPGSVNG